MPLLCTIYRHKFDKKKAIAGHFAFVPFVTCERCGKRFPMVYEDIWGWFGPVMRVAWWFKNRWFHLRCDVNRWRTRNDPPPF